MTLHRRHICGTVSTWSPIQRRSWSSYLQRRPSRWPSPLFHRTGIHTPPLWATIAVGFSEDDNRTFKNYPQQLFRSVSDKDQFERELHTINVAVVVNLMIFIAKFGVCYVSRSSSLFAEAIHSLADIGNQVLLRTGVLQALKGPTKMYNYGHSREKFVWSLISAVGVFFLGAGVSLLNGIQGIWTPRQLEDTVWVFYVLGASFVLEGYSFLVALRTVMHNAAIQKMKVSDYIWLGKDPTPIAVMLEDSGAVLGILVASACLIASNMTKNPIWDSMGSIIIGVLMGAVATFLIRMNRSFLIGRSISPKEINLIMKQLKEDPVVKQVHDCKSEEIAPGKYRFKAEIDFSGPVVVQRHLQKVDRNCVYDRLRHASFARDNKALHMALNDYGTELVSQVGIEVDKLEEKIRKVVPGVLHVDLEVDRGLIEKGLRCAVSEKFPNNLMFRRLAQPPEGNGSHDRDHTSEKNS